MTLSLPSPCERERVRVISRKGAKDAKGKATDTDFRR
jgi:hypothetical protein